MGALSRPAGRLTSCIRCGRPCPAGGRCWRHKTPPRQLRSSRAWQQLRATVAGLPCSSCGRLPAPGRPTEADHIRPAATHPQLALDPANIRPLCRSCHQERLQQPYKPR